MKIALGSDHAGFEYKENLRAFLGGLGHEALDFGTRSVDPVDYPPYVRAAALAVLRGQAERAIVLGGSGNGEAIAVNRLRGIRCALCWNVEVARLARAHNDANALALGQRTISWNDAREITRVWLETPFEGGRHARRIALLDDPDLA
jgi:ribose 5-phosphate isomerase B